MKLLIPALLLLCLNAALAQTPSPVTDPEAEARRLYKEGERLYSIGEWERAVARYKAAYELAPKPGLIFNIAQVYRLWGKPRDARFFYQQYLRAEPKAPNRKEVEARIVEMEAAIAAAPAPSPSPSASASPSPSPSPEAAPSPSAAPTPTSPPIPPPDRVAEAAVPSPPADLPRREGDRPLYKKWWFWAGIGAVAAGAVVATVVLTSGGGNSAPDTTFPVEDF